MIEAVEDRAMCTNCTTVDLAIAGTVWRLRNECPGLTLVLDPQTQEFRATGNSQPDVTVDVRLGTDFEVPGEVAFDTGLWRAYRGESYVFDFFTHLHGPEPYKRAIFNRDLTKGEILLSPSLLRIMRAYYPLEYPLDELAMMHRLSLGYGAELHCCGMATEDGRGYLFVGHSGAGKSTLGKLWVAERNARILSDDRVIITRKGTDFVIHGTPWHGEAALAHNSKASLKAIFLIQHGSKNELTLMNPVQASAELFSRSFVPWYRPESLSFSLGFIQDVASEVPVYILRSVPTPQVITFLEENCGI